MKMFRSSLKVLLLFENTEPKGESVKRMIVDHTSVEPLVGASLCGLLA